VSTLATHTHRRHHPRLSYVVLRSWDLARAQETQAALPAAEPFTMSFHCMLAFPRGTGRARAVDHSRLWHCTRGVS
jgi:hypothetical protein